MHSPPESQHGAAALASVHALPLAAGAAAPAPFEGVAQASTCDMQQGTSGSLFPRLHHLCVHASCLTERARPPTQPHPPAVTALHRSAAAQASKQLRASDQHLEAALLCCAGGSDCSAPQRRPKPAGSQRMCVPGQAWTDCCHAIRLLLQFTSPAQTAVGDEQGAGVRSQEQQATGPAPLSHHGGHGSVSCTPACCLVCPAVPCCASLLSCLLLRPTLAWMITKRTPCWAGTSWLPSLQWGRPQHCL